MRNPIWYYLHCGTAACQSGSFWGRDSNSVGGMAALPLEFEPSITSNAIGAIYNVSSCSWLIALRCGAPFRSQV